MSRATIDADFSEVGPPKPSGSSRARWLILGGLLIPFTVLSYLAVSSGSRNDVSDRPVILTALATITGPFVGAIARHGQDCCLSFSLTLAAMFGPILALGLLAQLVPLKRGLQLVRLVLWTLGWFVWLSAGQVSFLHALC